MKRFLLAILSICCATLVYAQKPTQDVLYLKNGSVVKGTIMSWTGEAVKIQTRDGSVFVYDSSDVKSRKIEQVANTVTGKKILDFPKQSFGIRAGASYAHVMTDLIYNENMWGIDPLNLNGFAIEIGGRYEHSMSQTNRWYFQTGLDLQLINTFSSDFVCETWYGPYDCLDVKSSTLFMDIPMTVSCKFRIGKNMGISSNIGFSHRIGLWGKFSGTAAKLDEYDHDNKTTDYYDISHNAFGYGVIPTIYSYDRYMFNLKAGIDFSIENVIVGVNLSIPLIGNDLGGILVFQNEVIKVGLTVGYNF